VLGRIGIITSKQLRDKARYSSSSPYHPAVLTPPDVISQASLAIPLLALYEGSIIAVAWWKRRPPPRRLPTGTRHPPRRHHAANPAE